MDVFDLMATINLDSSAYEKGLNDAEKHGTDIGGKIGKALSTAGKVAAAGLGAAATAIGFVTKSALSGYAEQQQLVGGVKKLYGNAGMSVEEYAQSVGKSVDEARDEWKSLEKAQNEVLKNADRAYKTAGMSANQYMATATSFSAALVNSLNGDTLAAAEKTDVAMRAISDNFNTFGGDIGMIEHAFQGFAKQNYMMLDNLKLGYGGTKTEMERLIADANEYAAANGQAANLSIDSFADIVTAIDLVQQKQGIAGTTAKEAASTVEGSLNMLKGAWENLLSGLGDADLDVDGLVDDVVSSAETVLENVLPVIQQALDGIGNLLTNVAPIISEKLPELVGTLLPPLIETATQLVLGLVQALPNIIQALIGAIPGIINTIVSMDWSGFASQIIKAFTNGFSSVVGALSVTGDMTISEILTSITNRLGEILSKGTEIVTNLVSGILEGAPDAINAAADILTEIIDWFMQNAPQLAEDGLAMIGQLAHGIISGLPQAMSALGQLIGRLIVTIAQNAPQFIQKGIELIGKLAAGLIRGIPQVLKSIPQIVSGMKQAFTGVDWWSVGSAIINGIANGLASAGGAIMSAALSAAKGALTTVKNFFGIKSPSKVFRDQVGKMIGAGLALGITDSIPAVIAAVDDMDDSIMDGFGDLNDYGADMTVSKTTTSDDGGFGNNGRVVYNYNTWNVDGAENPELFASRTARQLKMKVRMAY